MVGLFLLGAGVMLWLSADMRDEWRKLDSIDQHLAAGETPAAPTLDGGGPVEAPVEASVR
jgi:hypothetical protein